MKDPFKVPFRFRQRDAASGFTLVELMIATALVGLVLAGAVTTVNMWARSSMSLGNYADMSGSCRRSLDVFAYDVRMANGVSVSNSSTFTFTAYDDTGTGTASVTYSYDTVGKTLTRTYDGVSRIILENVEKFGFSYFDLNRNATTDALSVKVVQIEAVLLKTVLNVANTDEIISARFMLRNREVSV